MANPTSTGASAPRFIPVTQQHPFSDSSDLNRCMFGVNSGIPVKEALEQAAIYLDSIIETCKLIAQDADSGCDSILWGTVYLGEITAAILAASIAGLIAGELNDNP